MVHSSYGTSSIAPIVVDMHHNEPKEHKLFTGSDVHFDRDSYLLLPAVSASLLYSR